MGEGKDTIVQLSTWDAMFMGTASLLIGLYLRDRTHRDDASERVKALVPLECELLSVPVEGSGLFWWIFLRNWGMIKKLKGD